jgi:hypothetical protein
VTVTSLIRKSASRAYAGIRMPFALVENGLPERSKVRIGLHAALEKLDSAVGQLLRGSPTESAQPDDSSGTSAAATSPDVEAEREAIVEAVRERQPDVGELADPDLDVAEVQAQLQAKHAIQEREEVK